MNDKKNKIQKVLILNPYLPTLGGGEKLMGYFCEFIEKYYDFKVKIDILVFNYNDVDVTSKDYLKISDLNKQFGLNLKNVQIRTLDNSDMHTLYGKIKFLYKLSSVTKDYDLFINHMFLSKLIPQAKVNIYECMFPPHKNTLNFPGSKVIEKIYNYLFYHKYDAFVSISEFTDYWLKKNWDRECQSSIIYPPGFLLEDLKGRYQENKKKNIIVSCGRFFVAAHSKKQLEMVQFFVNNKDCFRDYQYHLVGMVSNNPVDIEYLDKIKKIIKDLDCVVIHENCEYSVLMNLYKEAKIFWHATGYNVDENREPIKMEHFGITTVEAMSYGVVPVVINKGGPKDVVVDNEVGFLWSSEIECIEKTKQLIIDDVLRMRMSQKAVERSKIYSIEMFNERSKMLFNELQI